MRRKKHLAVGLAAAIPATFAMLDSASADDVLYDTMWMVDDEEYDHRVWSGIAPQVCFNDGGVGAGTVYDRNAADDFTLDATYKITSITAGFSYTRTCIDDDPLFSGEGVLVEVFAPGGGDGPSATPVAQYFVTMDAGLTVSSFTDHQSANFGGRLLTIDLVAADIILEAGTWWLSVVVIDEEIPRYPWEWLRKRGYQYGHEAHIRCGNQAHGTLNYGCGWTPGHDWSPISILHSGSPNSPWNPGDVAMKIEGMLAPPKCTSADLDCNGSVGVSDLLILLAGWGPCPDCDNCVPDLTADCTVGVPDLLELLANWG